MSKQAKLSGGGISAGVLYLRSVTFEAGGAGTCDLREGSLTGTIKATLRLAGAGQVTWRSPDPQGVAYVGGLHVTLSTGTVSISYAVSRLWSPLDEHGLFAWWDFSDISTLFQDVERTLPITADAQWVFGVTDKSGNGHHLSEPTQPPAYDVGAIGGLSAVLGNSAMCLSTDALTLDQPITLVTVAKHSTGATGSNTTLLTDPNGGISLYALEATPDSIAIGNSAVHTAGMDANPHIWIAVFNGASSKLWEDGGAAYAGNAGVGTLTAEKFYVLGTGNRWPGHVGEVFFFTRAFSADDANRFGENLHAKWGVAWAAAS